MTNKSLLNLTKKKIKILENGNFFFTTKTVKTLKNKQKNRLPNFKLKKRFKKYLLKKTPNRRIRNCLNFKSYHKKFRTKPIHNKLTKKLSYFFHLKICSNNIFCVLREKNKMIKICSSGKYNIKISKKNLRYNIKPVITFFLQEIKRQVSSSAIFFLILTAPLRLRKQTLKFIFPKIFEDKEKRSFCVKVKEDKCFNGCRVRKEKRKKQKKLRLFKN
jgi:hypothetical protein